jgi:putative Holliday junction resolvase
VDFGQSRIGLAISEGELALPLEAIASSNQSVNLIADLAADKQASMIVVGLPLSLSGGHTLSTSSALDFAVKLSEMSKLEVRLVDERLTTRAAQIRLRDVGKSSKESKSIIDSESAAEILRLALSQIRLGKKPGIGLDEIEH